MCFLSFHVTSSPVWTEQAFLIFFLSNSLHHVHLPLKCALSSHLFPPDHPISHCADLSQGHSLHPSYASLVYHDGQRKTSTSRRCSSAKGGKEVSSTTAMENELLPLLSLETIIWGLHSRCRMVFSVSSSLLGLPGDPGSFSQHFFPTFYSWLPCSHRNQAVTGGLPNPGSEGGSLPDAWPRLTASSVGETFLRHCLAKHWWRGGLLPTCRAILPFNSASFAVIHFHRCYLKLLKDRPLDNWLAWAQTASSYTSSALCPRHLRLFMPLDTTAL